VKEAPRTRSPGVQLEAGRARADDGESWAFGTPVQQLSRRRG